MRDLSSVRALFQFGLLAVGICFGAQAQVQRSFLNTSFEQPSLGATSCYAQVYDNAVPFWSTTATTATQNGTCPLPGGTASGLIELWANSFNGVPARSGTQFAELNADQPSALYQNVCITNGETVSWALSHRGRTTTDTMVFVLGDTPTSLAPANILTTAGVGGILRASTDTAGNGTIVNCQAGSSVLTSTACTVAKVGTWADYKGAFTWNGTSGVKSVGFGAIGGGSSGNLLDAITLTLKAYLEFNTPPASGLESVASPTTLGIKVSGNVATSFTVPVTVTGGTAVLGVDFTTPNGAATFPVTIPAGNYTTATTIPLGIVIINDTFAETNETITFSMAPSTSASSYVTASTNSCGGAPALATTYTIIDDDRPTISINKTRVGGTGTTNFGISGTNGVPTTVTNIATTTDNTSTSAVALTNLPITTDGVAVTFTETQPTSQWRLTAVSCIDANAGNAQLGNTNPATNLATFSGNTVTIAAANVLHTAAFNCSVTNTRFADITLSKLWIDAVPNNAATVSATGLTDLLSVANTANETDTGAVQTVAVGSVLTLSETITTGTPTNYASSLACTGTAGLVGSTLTVGAADTAIVCSYTNKSIAVALTISKTDSKTVSTSGGTNNYVISLSNAGPGAADGVVVTDVVGAGLTCPPANAVTCLVTAGAAVCPAGPLTLANLTTGITIATFPNAGALQFAYTCNVN
jgi:trimeric autotransporter adhesin